MDIYLTHGASYSRVIWTQIALVIRWDKSCSFGRILGLPRLIVRRCRRLLISILLLFLSVLRTAPKGRHLVRGCLLGLGGGACCVDALAGNGGEASDQDWCRLLACPTR